MRVFQRGVNESLVIGNDVVVTILDVSSNYVRLGITDPHAIPTYWEETLYLEEQFEEDEEGSSLGLATVFSV